MFTAFIYSCQLHWYDIDIDLTKILIWYFTCVMMRPEYVEIETVLCLNWSFDVNIYFEEMAITKMSLYQLINKFVKHLMGERVSDPA